LFQVVKLLLDDLEELMGIREITGQHVQGLLQRMRWHRFSPCHEVQK
jgi:hypothetical protein